MSGSLELFKKAEKLIPGGVNSPVRSCKHVGVTPTYFQKGEGAYLYDVDGARYTDFCLSFGPHLLGHSHPRMVEAIQKQVLLGTSFGACHPGEVELAERLLRAYPFLQKARLVNSGTEAVMTAVRLARGYTGKPKIIVFDGCYHGHSDGLLAKAGSGVAELAEASSSGVPTSIVADTLIAKFGDLSSVEAHFRTYPDQIAAILLEPIPANNGLNVPKKEFLTGILNLAKKYGALTIFDEVISGFRVSYSGAAGLYDLQPDLVTLGKIIGGGLPLAALLGREEIMNRLAPLGDVYQAGTLSGNPLAVAAGNAVLKELEENPPYEILKIRTENFANELEKLTGARVHRVASLFWMDFGPLSESFPPEITPDQKKTYAEFFKRALRAGAYFAPSPYEVGFLSIAHTEQVLAETLERLRSA